MGRPPEEEAEEEALLGGAEEEALLGGEVEALLDGGYALVVAIVGEDEAPHALRGWGLTVLRAKPPRVRLVLSGDEGPNLQHRGGRRTVAITLADPLTLRAVQLKGVMGSIEPATEADRQTVARFCEMFFSAVEEADGTERPQLARLVPEDFVTCSVEIARVFDQTPGPGAGAALPSAAP